MDPAHRAVIQQNEDRLIQLINYESLEQHLVPLDIFTKAMVDDFKLLNDEERRTALIRDLPTRGPQAFSTFGKMLLNTNQFEAAEIFGYTQGGINNRYGSDQDIPYQSTIRHDGDSSTENTIKNTVQVFEGRNIYKMTSSPRGLCLLINNYDFKLSFGEFRNREGTHEDSEKINRVFKQLGFLVDQHDDLSGEEILNLLDEFPKREMHQHMDAVIVVILTHGVKGAIVGVDGKHIPIKTIISKFNNSNSQVLQGKPKLFFIQACRGALEDCGVMGTLTTDAARSSSSDKIASVTDILVAFSCIDDYVSYRDEIEGSWFIVSLMCAIQDHAHDTDIHGILTEMERRIQNLTGAQGEVTSTETRLLGFRKTFYFNPGYSG